MIYTNTEFNIENKKCSWGMLQLCVVRNEKGNVLFSIPSSKRIKKGLNPMLSVGYTKTKEPRLITERPTEMYMLLRTKKPLYYVKQLNKEPTEFIKKYTPKDGEECQLIKTSIIRAVVTLGKEDDDIALIVNKGEVRQTTIRDVIEYAHNDIEFIEILGEPS